MEKKSMVYSYSVWFYFWKSIQNFKWQRYSFGWFIFMLILLVWCNMECLYIPTCLSEETANDINAIFENFSCGYIASYLTYVATSHIPNLVKMRHHRVMLAENARLLYDYTADFLSQLFDVKYGEKTISENDLRKFCYNFCDDVAGCFRMKQHNRKFVYENTEKIKRYQAVLEEGYDDLFPYEREILMELQFSSMWKIFEQLNEPQCLFRYDQWKLFSDKIIEYLKYAEKMSDSLKSNKSGTQSTPSCDVESNGLTVNIFSIINNKFIK